MGNLLGTNSSDTINWDQINTEDMSPTIPNLKGLNKDAEVLIKHLQMPSIDTLENSEVNKIFQQMDNKNNSPVKNQIENNNSFSDTSPFISSEMYKYLKNDSIQQQGGANNNSSTSTSSSKSSESYNGNISYISSSAHTEGNKSEINTSPEIESTTLSINDNVLSNSINTSDINMVSTD